MTALDPKKLFHRLAGDIPGPLQKHLFIVGSLAAAYHFRAELERRAVNTKDADVVIYPAGDVRSAKALAVQLLDLGWTRTPKCFPMARRSPANRLRAFRLHPPKSRDYFIELLGLPAPGQSDKVVWVPVRLADGWYGVGCHRFMRLTAFRRLKSSEGLEYASPAMMALSNLLSHPAIGHQRMNDPVRGRKILRSAKDLGRVLALAWLSGRDATEAWLDDWVPALRQSFPRRWRAIAREAGAGLQNLLADPEALEEARVTTDVGLLNGRAVTAENLVAVGLQLMADVVRPLAGRARQS
jgi:hypothetical protein